MNTSSFYKEMQSAKTKTTASQRNNTNSLVPNTNDRETIINNFLAAVLPKEKDSGTYSMLSLKSNNKVKAVKDTTCKTIRELTNYAVKEDEANRDVFICLSKNSGPRRAINTTVIKTFFADIDCGKNKQYINKDEAINGLKEFYAETNFPQHSLLIDSGNGWHIYWILKEPISADEWKPIAEGVKNTFIKNNLHIDVSVTADVTRVLRVPTTHNYKNNQKKEVVVSPDTELRYSASDFNKYTASKYDSNSESACNSDLYAGIHANTPKEIAIKINSWLKENSSPVKIKGTRKKNDGIYLDFSHCLFHEGHDTSHSPAVFIGADGVIGWSCRGDKCADIHWRDVRKLLDPSYFVAKNVFQEPEALEYMNDNYFVAIWGDTFVTVRKSEHGIHRIKDAEFKKLLANVKVIIKNERGADKRISISGWWLSHAKRREYALVLFDPSKAPNTGIASTGSSSKNENFNLWTGFAIEPKKGDWILMHAHIREIICAGDDTLFEYILNWVALLFQQPHRPHGSSIILKSEREGTGKGIFMGWLRTICGHHSMLINNKKQLVGGFNRHLENKIFIGADEPTYAGDHAANSVLKSLITEDKLTVEPKGFDSYEVNNHISLMIATNEEWVINAGLGARRFVICEVDDSKAGDVEYFRALCEEADNGGIEAMFSDMLERDIRKFKPQVIVKTKALHNQRVMSLDAFDRLLVDMCSQDTATPYAEELKDMHYPLGTEVSTSNIYRNYEYNCKQTKRSPISKSAFAMRFSKKLKIKTRKVQKNNMRVTVYDIPEKTLLITYIRDLLN